MGAPLTNADLAGMRAAAQHVLPASELDVPDVAERVLAFQAQDFGAGCWSLGLRATEGTARSAVHAALAAGTIVRSWPLRTTLEIVPATALRPMLAVTGERSLRSFAGRRRSLGLDDADLRRGEALARERLAAGPVRRPELMAFFEEGGVSVAGQRGAHLLLALAVMGVCCFGPLDGKQHTLVLVDQWVPAADDPILEPLPWLATRYATSHGPVRVPDLAWWAGITKREAARGFAEAGDSIVELATEGEPVFVGRESAAFDEDAVAAARETVALLPAFDELLLGYADRTAALPRELAGLVAPGANGLFHPVITVGGRVVGTWRAERGKAGTGIRPTPFPGERLPDGLDEAAAAFARFDVG